MREKETWEKTMTEVDSNPACVRAEDLVSYLYGEMDQGAAQDFEAHAQHCASCRTELIEFRQVRASIGEWRGQALGSLASPIAANSSPVIAEPTRMPERKRTALAAIREFFALSPVWMRAATVTLAVVFCALIALTIAHYFEQPKTITVVKTVPVKTSVEEVARTANEPNKNNETVPVDPKPDSPEQPVIKIAGARKDSPHPKASRALRPDATAQPELVATPGLKISPRESREIARDLRLASNDEDDLPRLSDLMDESN